MVSRKPDENEGIGTRRTSLLTTIIASTKAYAKLCLWAIRLMYDVDVWA